MKHQVQFETEEAINRPLPISIGLSGGSGTGKTYSALLLARGMASELSGPGAPVAFVDTENRRGLHYLDDFPEIRGSYIDFGPEIGGRMVGYPADRWIDLLDFVAASGVGAMVVDSWSHSWEGIGGVLEQQAEVLSSLGEGEANNIRAWAKVKPTYRKLINRVIQFPIPVILCTRAKPVLMKRQKIDGQWVETPIGKTKTRRKDIPWDVAADGDLLFEMLAMAILDHEHPGCPKYQVKIADQFKRLWAADRPLTEETGREMARWSKRQSTAQADKALMDAARAAARGGQEELQAHWKTLSQDQRAVLLPIMDEIKRTATEATQRAAVSGDDLGFSPTPEQLAAAEAEARAAIEAQTQEAEQ